MKTLDEVIKAMDNDCTRCGECPYVETRYCKQEMQNDALHYLKEYQKTQKTLEIRAAEYKRGFEQLGVEWSRIKDNPPLTWDELKGMEGKPVWVEYNLHLSDKDARSRMWIIIQQIFPWKEDNELIYYSGFVYGKEEIGKTWQAYRMERKSDTSRSN